MSLFKRNQTWWIRIRTPSGQLIRQSAKTTIKKEAQELHDRLRAEAWRKETLHVGPKRTWDEAAMQWLLEAAAKRDIAHDRQKLRWLNPVLKGRVLDTICREDLVAISNQKAKEASQATANRYMALIRAILRKAALEWEWIDRVPKVPMFKEATRRIRWLTREEADRLLAELPPHQEALARFALATGLRQGNILGLTWQQVDLGNQRAWIHADEAKGRRAIPVPLNADAMRVLEQQLGNHRKWVFTWQGKRIKQVNTHAFQKALRRAGIEDFRWHDLRHTWASWHAQAGTPLHALQELGGWETVSMVRRYAHYAPDHLAQYVGNVEFGAQN